MSTASHFPFAAIAVAVAAVAVVWKQQKELEDAKKELTDAKKELTDAKALLDKTYYSLCEKVFRTEEIIVDNSTGAAELGNIEQHLCQDYPKSFQKKGCHGKNASMFPGETEKDGQIGEAHIIPKDRTCSLHWGPILAVSYRLNVDRKTPNCITGDDLRHKIEGQFVHEDKSKQEQSTLDSKDKFV